MRNRTKLLLVALALVTSLAAAPALFADDNHRDHGRDGMMGKGGMMGMMGSMMRMMEHCNQMMESNDRKPNERWRDDSPKSGEKR